MSRTLRDVLASHFFLFFINNSLSLSPPRSLSPETRSRFLVSLVGLLAQTGALIMERLYRFVRALFTPHDQRFEFLCSPGFWRAVSQASVSATLFPIHHMLSPVYFLCLWFCSFFLTPHSVLASHWCKGVLSTVGTAAQVRALSSVSFSRSTYLLE